MLTIHIITVSIVSAAIQLDETEGIVHHLGFDQIHLAQIGQRRIENCSLIEQDNSIDISPILTDELKHKITAILERPSDGIFSKLSSKFARKETITQKIIKTEKSGLTSYSQDYAMYKSSFLDALLSMCENGQLAEMSRKSADDKCSRELTWGDLAKMPDEETRQFLDPLIHCLSIGKGLWGNTPLRLLELFQEIQADVLSAVHPIKDDSNRKATRDFCEEVLGVYVAQNSGKNGYNRGIAHWCVFLFLNGVNQPGIVLTALSFLRNSVSRISRVPWHRYNEYFIIFGIYWITLLNKLSPQLASKITEALQISANLPVNDKNSLRQIGQVFMNGISWVGADIDCPNDAKEELLEYILDHGRYGLLSLLLARFEHSSTSHGTVSLFFYRMRNLCQHSGIDAILERARQVRTQAYKIGDNNLSFNQIVEIADVFVESALARNNYEL